MRESFLATFAVGLEGAVAWALSAALLRAGPLRRAVLSLAAALLAGLLVGAGTLAAARGRGLSPNEVAPALARAGHLVAVALLAGAALLRRRSAEHLFGSALGRSAAEVALLAGGVAFLLPEGAFLAARLDDLALLAGEKAFVRLSALAGLAAAGAAGVAAAWAGRRLRLSASLTPSSLLALLFALKMAGVAASAVDAHTLPAALGGVIGRAVHDGVHLAFVTFQVPDHPYLKDGVYQAILVLLDPLGHDLLTAAVLAAPLVAGWVAFRRRPPPALPEGTRAPERRLARAAFRRGNRAAGAAFAAAIVLSSSAIASARARSDELYEPVPEPVVDDGAGTVIVPLAGPLSRGAGERMRKWVYAEGDRSIVFFTVRLPDGGLSAALDLCEICQPRGYAQLGPGHVFCKYCRTPIPVGTVGQPGGCNPVPVPGATVKGAALLVPRDALVSAWRQAMAGKR
ncbi:MAG TPA: Fe-S-containing protein [Anaeromyxobacteraceae bacterium]|nr:Fe-S-containing protein [Anaeromyxobacteraceae bacterium]